MRVRFSKDQSAKRWTATLIGVLNFRVGASFVQYISHWKTSLGSNLIYTQA
jgi:hypothetical protein